MAFFSARRRPMIWLAVVVASLATAASGVAEEWRLDLDPAATDITFELGATLHTVHGTARLGEGRVEFDLESGVASGRIVVAADSVSTDHQGRDAKMHAKVLESPRYPELVFEPHSVSGELHGEGDSRLTVGGTFSIHGEEHPLSVDVVVRLQGEDLSVEAKFDVPYVAWGMRDPSRLVMRVAKQVGVHIEGLGRLTRMADSQGVDE